MLRIKSKGRSSALRELEGIIETVVAMNLPWGSKVIAVVDNEAVAKILEKGSGLSELRALADYFFLYCLVHGLMVFAVWQRRDTQIMVTCDTGSRIVDSCAYSAHPDLFWKANEIACRCWGHGFTFDRFASPSQVQPLDVSWKLPFASRFVSAFSSGTDALAQWWQGHVNWVNAPFGLVGKVISLLKSQRAVAAVVVPRGWRGTRHWWASELQEWSEGVVFRWDIHPQDYRCWPVNAEVKVEPRRFGLAVVFLDFRRSDDPDLTEGWPAENVHTAWVGAGRPGGCTQYWRLGKGWMEGLPCL